jgi:hypothetical protein
LAGISQNSLHKIKDNHFFSRNIIHGSDSLAAAKKEIGLWFKEEELMPYKMDSDFWLYEQPGLY